MILRAKLPILYASRQYGIGEALPAGNQQIVNAWLESGAAFWEEVEPEKKAPKAVPVTAAAGIPGKSNYGDPEPEVSKVPKRGRKR